MIETIRQVANKVVQQKYPLLSNNRYNTFDITVILQSYVAVLEYYNEIPKTEKESKLSQPTNSEKEI